MFQHTIQINLTPEQLGQLFDDRLAKALANFTPLAPIGAELPELMTRKEVAAHLRVSLTTLHEWAKDTEDRAALLVPQKTGLSYKNRFSQIQPFSVRIQHSKFNFEYV